MIGRLGGAVGVPIGVDFDATQSEVATRTAWLS